MKKNIDKTLIQSWYKTRNPDSHKGTYGHGLLLAGSKGMMGAAVISSRACMRAGIGLLSTIVPPAERVIIQQSIPEAMLEFKLPAEKKIKQYAAVGAGPGLGTGRDVTKKIEDILKTTPQKLLLDADALNVLSANKALMALLPAKTILTPHVKEFDRIFGESSSKEERINNAIKAAKQHNIVIVLKNATTIITDGTNTYYNESENAALAKGGSGDMLSGIILALLAQGYDPVQAAGLGVYIHSTAAELCLQSQSVESMLATDVIEYIGDAFKALQQ